MAREIKALLDEEIAAYAARNPRSQAMFARAKQSLPGGNTRTGVPHRPFPPLRRPRRGSLSLRPSTATA